jgi:hypothetical protein
MTMYLDDNYDTWCRKLNIPRTMSGRRGIPRGKNTNLLPVPTSFVSAASKLVFLKGGSNRTPPVLLLGRN